MEESQRIPVVTAKVAAEEKGCTPQAIYQAADRGVLNEVRLGGSRLIMRDDQYRHFEVQQTGGRTHKTYLSKQINEE